MWIFTSDSFLSIVSKRGDPRGTLTVRARVAGDIERVFPTATVRRTPSGDYLFRAQVAIDDVARAMVRAVRAVDYDNFKASVVEHDRHDAYAGVWREMMRLQVARQRARVPANRGRRRGPQYRLI